MKKISLLFAGLALMMAVSTGCGSSPSIVGVWQLDSVSSEELTESEKSATVEFKDDGSVIQKRGQQSDEGKWELNEKDGKKMLVTTFNGQSEEVEIKTLDATTLAFEDRGYLVTFKRK